MFSKPEHGWCKFSIEDFEFWFSYLNDTPQDFIDQFKQSLDTHIPFCVEMEGEPTQCILVIDDYWFLHIIVNEYATIDEMKEYDDDLTLRSYKIYLIDFVQEFIDDMEKYKEEFSNWQDDPKEYDLSELKGSLNKYKSDRGIK